VLEQRGQGGQRGHVRLLLLLLLQVAGAANHDGCGGDRALEGRLVAREQAACRAQAAGCWRPAGQLLLLRICGGELVGRQQQVVLLVLVLQVLRCHRAHPPCLVLQRSQGWEHVPKGVSPRAGHPGCQARCGSRQLGSCREAGGWRCARPLGRRRN
jgi:hypothetical protein